MLDVREILVKVPKKDRKYVAFGKEKINSFKNSSFCLLVGGGGMLDGQWWGLAILVSQKLTRALPKPTWRVVLEGTSGEALSTCTTHIRCSYLLNREVASLRSIFTPRLGSM
jgi:hypothetical protein